jgi:hypothetical protein
MGAQPPSRTAPTQGSVQSSVLEVLPLPSVSLQSAEEHAETCSSEHDTADDPYVVEGVVSRRSFRDWRKLESAWYRLESAWYRWLSLYEDSWQRRFSSNVLEDTSGSDCDSMEFGCYPLRIPTQDRLPPQHIQNSWRRDCTISFDESDLDGAWELPFLTASDCAGELEMIRYAICLSTMAFEEDAATAVSWEHDVSLSGRLERARFASQMASLKHHWETSRGHLRRQHITRKISVKRSSTAQARPSPSTSQSENRHD